MLLTNEQKAELWADREYIRGTTSWERNRDCALEILRNAEIISGHSHAPQSPGVEGETDLDKKVKEAVDRAMVSGSGARLTYEYLAREIQSLCQQDAERREEDAFEAAREVETDPDDDEIGPFGDKRQTYTRKYYNFAAYKQSREGQEGKENNE